ncbi:MAG: hypothetical protein DA443_03815 [Bacteroidetes bacterium]|nr:MAG: hypothetical protein DA443_03815 [Bacteroidota bacterium]
MDIQYVKKDMVDKKGRRASRYKELYDALDQIEPGGKAVEVTYDEGDLINSMRVAVYQYNKRYGVNIKSVNDVKEKKIFFFID